MEKKQKDQICVSVVGFANVGKSSIINVLKNKTVVATNSIPYLTKSIKDVKLNNQIVLLDTPGVMNQGILAD